MSAVLAIALKDLTLVWRDKFALFWIFAFPLMYALFFGTIFGGGDGDRGSILVTVVDEARSDSSLALIQKLDGNEGITVARAAQEEGSRADPPPESLTLEQAREAVRKGQRVAYVHIPPGYGDSPFAVFGAQEDDTATVSIGIDPRRQAEAGFLQGVIMESMFGSLTDQFSDRELMHTEIGELRSGLADEEDIDEQDRESLDTFLSSLDTFLQDYQQSEETGTASAESGGFDLGEMVRVVDISRERGKRPRSTFEITFPQALVWGLMSVAMTFAVGLVRERKSGTLLRLSMAPIGRTRLLAGKATACFLACLVTMGVLMGFGALALGVRFDDVTFVLLAMLCTAVCFTGLMMLISVMGKTENAVAGSSWALMMPFAMIGGGMIPLIAMPSWLATASNFSPFKWAITAVEGGLWRGFDLADMVLPCLILLAIGAITFFSGVTIFRRGTG